MNTGWTPSGVPRADADPTRRRMARAPARADAGTRRAGSGYTAAVMLSRTALLAVSCAVLVACDGGGMAEGWRMTPPGTGPRIVWDLAAEPLPEIPLPNDVATWPDPTSPTGRRLNASQIAPSAMERNLRANFDHLDGWGTFAPITLSFDAPIDTDALLRRQGRGHFSATDFARHAIYLVDMQTGVPIPLDVGSGLFPRVVADPNAYYTNDPRDGSSNLLFETVEEDTNGNGMLDPGEDTDFDGVLDHPNTLDGRLDGTPNETVDRMLWFYERQTNTLMVRPIVPLGGDARVRGGHHRSDGGPRRPAGALALRRRAPRVAARVARAAAGHLPGPPDHLRRSRPRAAGTEWRSPGRSPPSRHAPTWSRCAKASTAAVRSPTWPTTSPPA